MNALRNTGLQSSLRGLRTQPVTSLAAMRFYATGGAQKVPDTGNSSAYPAKGPEVDRHNLSNAENVAHATKRVNQFAKRDPSLYPLSIIVVAFLGFAGYFFTSKMTGTNDATRNLQMHGLVAPWDEEHKHGTLPSQVAEFKYRHKTREGHYEDSLPALTSETVQLNESINPKYKAA